MHPRPMIVPCDKPQPFQFTFVSGVPCTWSLSGTSASIRCVAFQFTFVSGVPCTSRRVTSGGLRPTVSIHLREWGAMHPGHLHVGRLRRGMGVSNHLREWGAMHPPTLTRGEIAAGFNSPS